MYFFTPWIYYAFAGFTCYGVVLAVVLWRKRKQDESYKFLLIVIGIVLAKYAILTYGLGSPPLWPYLAGLSLPLCLSVISLMYLFSRSLMRRKPLLCSKHWPVVAVPLLGLIWCAVVFSLAFNGYFSAQWIEVHYWNPFNITRVSLLVGLGVYVAMEFRHDMREFKAEMGEQVSDFYRLHIPTLELLWGLGILSVVLRITDFVAGPHIHLWPFLSLIHLAAVYYLVQFALFHSRMFTWDQVKSPKSKLQPHEFLEIERKLKHALEVDHLYLNPEIRLNDVAQHIHVKPYKISSVLRTRFRMNFFEFVNSYRIQHAKGLLQSDAHHFNIAGIAMESGFNSKSVFNDTFKRLVGVTPSQFKQQICTDSGVQTT